MRNTARPIAFALAAAFAAAPALGAQTTPSQPPTSGGTTGTSGSTGGTGGTSQDTSMHGGQHGTSRQGAMGRSGAADSGLVAQLDSVNTAAKAGLTNLPAAAAVSLIQGIETRLRGTRNAGLRSIAADLASLRSELGQSTINGRRVGTILSRVGPKVTRVAGTQSGALRTTLRSVGSELTSAGRSLSAGRAAATTTGN